MTELNRPAGSQAPDERRASSFEDIAAGIADGPIRSRQGFGAFRHYNGLLQDTARLVFESGLFTLPQDWPWGPWPPDPEFWLFHRSFGCPRHVQLFRRLLATPTCYHPPAIWALFWALAKAEHRFTERYLPFWSHEERLTGHLVSEIMERIGEFSPEWKDLARTNANTEPPRLELWYADLAASRREKETGGDLGLIVHGCLPGHREFFKVLRFQAKKVGPAGSLRLDIQQHEALAEHNHLGQYVLYHAADSDHWQLPPTVLPVSEVTTTPEDAKAASKTIPGRNDGYDLAAFMTFAGSDPASSHGVLASDPRRAAAILLHERRRVPPPSRVVVITLGSPAVTVDWFEAFGGTEMFPTPGE